MNDTDAGTRRTEMERWLAVANDDLAAIEACLSVNPVPLAAAAYHCQQAVEKMLKGLLILAAIRFRRTHDLKELTNLVVPAYPSLETLVMPLLPITVWGFAYRYPFEEEPQEPLDETEVRTVLAQIRTLAAAAAAATPPGAS